MAYGLEALKRLFVLWRTWTRSTAAFMQLYFMGAAEVDQSALPGKTHAGTLTEGLSTTRSVYCGTPCEEGSVTFAWRSGTEEGRLSVSLRVNHHL